MGDSPCIVRARSRRMAEGPEAWRRGWLECERMGELGGRLRVGLDLFGFLDVVI